MSDEMASGRRSFVIACLVGGGLAVAVFVAMLHVGPGGFFRQETFGNFFDTQASSWLHGHWDVPPDIFYVEGFRHAGKTYTYFGPWPSFVRLPILAISDEPSGHMTPLFMTIAFATTLAGVGAMQWRLRELFRPGRPLGRGEQVLTGAIVFFSGCGTSLLFLTSRAWVYHEALLWGVGFSIVSYERMIAFMMRPNRARLIGAAVFGGLAFLSRASVGTGPMVALGLILAGRILRVAHDAWTARRTRTEPVIDADAAEPAPGATQSVTQNAKKRGLFARIDWLGGSDDGRSWIVPLFIALLIPAVIYVYVNYSKFGTLFSIPWRQQVLTLIDARHRELLEANGGTYFGLRFAPTTMFQYFRPDALALDPHFPWITFPHYAPHIFGDAPFDTLDPSTSVVASMPAFFVLSIVGSIAAVLPRFGRTPEAAFLRIPLIGAIAGVAPTIAISYIAQRYLGDFVPYLAIAAVAGIQVLFRRYEDAPRPALARATIVVLTVLAIFGIWVNGGLAVLYGRLYNPNHATDRIAMLELQRSLDVGGPYAVGHSDALPDRPSRAGTTWIVGDCDSVYWSDGGTWWPIQGTTAGGWFRLRVRPADLESGWQPLLVDGTPGSGFAVGVKPNTGRAAGTAQLGLGYLLPDGAFSWPATSTRLPFGPGAHEVDILMDSALRHVRVTVDGASSVLVAKARSAIPAGPFTVNDRIRQLPDRIDLCRDILDRSKA